jgi:ABC-type transporter Mla maintaining outer membrane lipid asymmetry ATPase subunit MlaF
MVFTRMTLPRKQTGLAPMADIINDLIVDCVERLGATTISITHDMGPARSPTTSP